VFGVKQKCESGIREPNPSSSLGKAVHSRYANPGRFRTKPLLLGVSLQASPPASESGGGGIVAVKGARASRKVPRNRPQWCPPARRKRQSRVGDTNSICQGENGTGCMAREKRVKIASKGRKNRASFGDRCGPAFAQKNTPSPRIGRAAAAFCPLLPAGGWRRRQ
jgi:hypothetical protein